MLFPILLIVTVIAIIIIANYNKNLTKEQKHTCVEHVELEPIELPSVEELAPESTPEPSVIKEITKKNIGKKKPTKNTAKSKSLAKMESKPKKKPTKK